MKLSCGITFDLQEIAFFYVGSNVKRKEYQNHDNTWQKVADKVVNECW